LNELVTILVEYR